MGRGAAFADYDNDGDVDAVVMNHGGPPALLRNDGTSGRSWLAVGLEGRASNRSGFGARLRVVAGERVQVRQLGAQAPYLSQNAPVAHFGLGGAQRVDSLIVEWPSGVRDVYTDIAVKQRLRLVESAEALP